MTSDIDKLLERMRTDETQCRDLALRLDKYGDSLEPPERNVNEDVRDHVQILTSNADFLARSIAAVEELRTLRAGDVVQLPGGTITTLSHRVTGRGTKITYARRKGRTEYGN